jgi:hypothetical protein
MGGEIICAGGRNLVAEWWAQPRAQADASPKAHQPAKEKAADCSAAYGTWIVEN